MEETTKLIDDMMSETLSQLEQRSQTRRGAVLQSTDLRLRDRPGMCVAGNTQLCHHRRCCSVHKSRPQQPQRQRHTKHTHWHELALCHEGILDIMTHPWVPYTVARIGRLWVGSQTYRTTLHTGPKPST